MGTETQSQKLKEGCPPKTPESALGKRPELWLLLMAVVVVVGGGDSSTSHLSRIT